MERLKSSREIETAPASRAPLFILLAVALGLALTWGKVMAVWKTGLIYDPDDAMRLVEVRALLAGQSWFDMSVHRLDPPMGSIMHWSRVVDIPLALLAKGFGLVLPMEQAERLMRIVFPLAMQLALYAGMARLARTLLGRAAVTPAIFMVLLSGIAFGQFQPGRIDHHAPQIVLLVFMLGALAEAVAGRRLLPGLLAAGCAALSIAISLENLPFILVTFALLALSWAWQGSSCRSAIAGLGAGFTIALPVCFFATVGPSHWFESIPDAFSFGQLLAGMSGGIILLALSFLPAHTSRALRLGLLLGGGLLTLGLTFWLAPQVLQGPFSGIDPLVRDIWLSNVHEAWSFMRLAQKEPDTAAIFMIPLSLGVVFSLLAMAMEKGTARHQWMLVAAVSLLGLLMSLWLIRVLTSVGPIAPLGGLWLAMRLNRYFAGQGKPTLASACYALLLLFAPVPWALVLSGDEVKAEKAAQGCRMPAAFTAFADLPPGLILAPIDAGSHLLAFTPHSVMAAPYHRNNHGNLAALHAFLASPDEARSLVIESGARYVAVCAGLGETTVLGQHAPQSLASALVAGEVPDWLSPVAAANTPYRIFTLRP